MKKYFVTRHQGAIEWAERHGISGCEMVSHFDASSVNEEDIVIGTLPINIVADICKRGGEYYHLSLDLPAEARGKELSANDMDNFGARIEKLFAASTGSALNAKVFVGEWNEEKGEYVPLHGGVVEVEGSVQGVVLKLKKKGSEDVRDIYVERLPESWRINISMDQSDMSAIISLNDEGEVIFE